LYNRTVGEGAQGEVGRVIGRYLLCDAIASGGMATVHLGRLLGPVGFSRTVAIKRLHPYFARDPEFVAMFLDEARLAARIRHPNVVSTLDVVVLQGELFVVMDYVHGEALSKMVRANGAVPPSIAASIIAGVLYGLHAAHEAKNDDGSALQIVHRDVSPQNVLVGIDGVARVVDFGVAKAVGRLQTTREGALKGKIAYMSPEQVSSDTIDRRTDVYAASVVLWEMLTGTRLFHADNEVRVLQQVLTGKIDPPSKHAAIPRELDALVMKGLSHDANDRFATAWEMAEQIQRIAFATPGQVSEWVQRIGAQTLAARAKMIADVESDATPAPVSERATDEDRTLAYEPKPIDRAPRLSAPAIAAIRASVPAADESAPVPPTPPIDPHSQVSALNVSSAARAVRFRSIKRGTIAIFVAVGALFAGGVIVVAVHSTSGPSHAASSAPTASATQATTLTPINPAVSAAEIAPLAQQNGDAPSATASHAPPARVPTATARPKPPNCNPPYTIKDGIRVPKMECL
jgi:eukaryotic-like serine/threonine-protein kinase